MGVPFRVLAERPLGGYMGPAAGGCHPEQGVYLLERDGTDGEAWTWVLHELAHVVWWHPVHGADIEEDPLIAWEYAVCRHFGVRGYFDTAYTRNTRVSYKNEYREISWFTRPTRAAWFKAGREEAVMRGALTPDFRPTWQRPL